MSDVYGDDFITISDEDGKEYELEVLCTVEYQGVNYLGVCPACSEDSEELEVSILRVSTDEDGEELLEAVQDEDELNAVYELMLFEDPEADEEPEN